MKFNCIIAICDVLQFFYDKLYSYLSVILFSITSVIFFSYFDVYQGKAFASESVEVFVSPSNFSSHLNGFDHYNFKIPTSSDVTYVFYNNNEFKKYPEFDSLTLNNSNISLYIDGKDNNFNKSDKIIVSKFIIEDGALKVEAGPGLSIETDKFFQYGGVTEIISSVAGQVGLKANNVEVDAFIGTFSVLASTGVGVESNLTLKSGNVLIQTSLENNVNNDSLISWQGNVKHSGGFITLNSINGTALKSHEYILSGGGISVASLNFSNMSDVSPIGINLDEIFYQSAGISFIKVDGNNTVGILLKEDARYVMDGGKAQTRILAQKNGVGLKNSLDAGKIANDNIDAFTQNAGHLSIEANKNGKAIYFEDAGVKINGGNTTIESSEGGIGVEIVGNKNPLAGFVLNEGNVKISAIDKNSIGLKSEYVLINGGIVDIFTNNNGRAIDIGSGRFDMRAGNLYLRQGSNPQGIAIYGDENSSAFFGKDANVETNIDLDAVKQMTGLMSFGHVTIEEGAKLKLTFTNTANILSNKYSLDQSKSENLINISLLESKSTPILGKFIVSPENINGETLFYDYRLVLNDNQKDYRLVITPKNTDGDGAVDNNEDSNGNNENINDNNNNEYNSDSKDQNVSSASDNNGSSIPNNKQNLLLPSHLLSGANKNAALTVENVLAGGRDNVTQNNLNKAFDKLYNSQTQIELVSNARGLTAHQTTKLPNLTLVMLDRVEADLLTELDKTSQLTEKPILTRLSNINTLQSPFKLDGPLVKNSKENLVYNYWVRPISLMNRYQANDSSHVKLTANYTGLSVGFSNQRDRLTLAGSASFFYGDLSGYDGYRAKSNNLLLMAGLKTDKIKLIKHIEPSFKLVGAYGYSQYNQNRRDVLGTFNQADININSARLGVQMLLVYDFNKNVRLQPKIGADYSYLRLSHYKERGIGVLLNVDAKNYNSWQPNIGSDIIIVVNDKYAFTAYGTYRYEMMDRNIGLRTRFVDAQNVVFISEGEKSNRSSASIGANGQVKINNTTSISGGYDLFMSSKIISHQVYLQGITKF